MSPKTEKSVPSVETPKPKQSNEKLEPLMGIEIPKKALKLAKSVGIDLKPIVDWASSMEERQNNTEKAIMILAESNRKLQPLVELAQRVKQRQAEAQASGETNIPQGRAGIVEGLLTKALMGGGGGGSDEMMQAMMKKMFEKSIMGMDLSNALTKAMIIKLAPELAGELTKSLVKKAE